MHRYYISFSHQARAGFAIGTADFTMGTLIASIDDLTPIKNNLAQQGYSNIAILAFSLYSDPAPAAQPPMAPRHNTPSEPRPHAPRRGRRS